MSVLGGGASGSISKVGSSSKSLWRGLLRFVLGLEGGMMRIRSSRGVTCANAGVFFVYITIKGGGVGRRRVVSDEGDIRRRDRRGCDNRSERVTHSREGNVGRRGSIRSYVPSEEVWRVPGTGDSGI